MTTGDSGRQAAKARADGHRPALEAHLLGCIEYDDCLALQQRLVYEQGGSNDGQIVLLICEHPNLITIGRHGSWDHVRCDRSELVSRQLPVRWINRGGGCILHTAGQVAVYPIVPLEWHGFTLGEYLQRLRHGIGQTLAELSVPTDESPMGAGLTTRNGQVAYLGVAVKNWVTYYGAYINVAPRMDLIRLVESDPWRRTRASCLAAERRQRIKMTAVREGLVRHLSAAFGCDRYHLYTGHPYLRRVDRSTPEARSRVG